MTNPMIERVAEAMKAALEARAFVHGNRISEGILPGELNFDGTIELYVVARAAIEAMREPTEAMTDHAHKEIKAAGMWTEVPESTVWEHMIDAALKEG